MGIPRETRSRIADLSRDFAAIKSQYETTAKRKEDAEARYDAVKAAQELVQELSREIQVKVHAQVSELVTECLRAVFPDDHYTFEIEFESKRGKTEAVLVFKRNSLRLADPIAQAGGGVVDVASFALRLAAVLLSKPKVRPVMILDEPFKFVSVAYRQNIVDLLQELNEKLGMQFLIVTHIQELEMGTVYRISSDT